MEKSHINVNEDAVAYIGKVRSESLPHVFKEFLEILKDSLNGMNTIDLIHRIANLFQGKKFLLLGFNNWLPNGFKIVYQYGKAYYRTPGQPIPILISTKSTEYVQKQDEKDSKMDSSSEGMNKMRKGEEGETKDTKANSRPVNVKYELLATEEDAIQYAKQMRESISNPNIYKEFLHIMKSYASRHDITGAIIQIANLFQGKNTLILGFKKFLPPGFNIVVKNGIVYYCAPEQRNLTPDLINVEGSAYAVINQEEGREKLTKSIEDMNHSEDTLETSTKIQNKQQSTSTVKKRIRIDLPQCQNHDSARKRARSTALAFTEQDALTYMNQVRAEFRLKPGIHKEVLEAMGVCLNQQDVEGAIPRIAEMFQGKKKSLVLGFNKFLPDGYEIAHRNGTVYYRTPEEPFLIPVFKSDEHWQKQNEKSGKEDSSCQGILDIRTKDDKEKKCTKNTFESSAKDSKIHTEIGKKRQNTDPDKDEDHTETKSDDAKQKRERVEAQQNYTETVTNSTIQDEKSGTMASTFESKNNFQKRKEGEKNVVISQSIEASSPNLSNLQKEVGKKRQNNDVNKVGDQTESNSYKTARKRARVEAQQDDTESSKSDKSSSSFRNFDKLYEDYLSIKKVSETLSQTLYEAELQLYNRAKDLKVKGKDLDDANIEIEKKDEEIKAKDKELEKVTTKVESLEHSLYALKNRTQKEMQAKEAVCKKAEDACRYVISKKNEEIKEKERDIISKDSMINTQREEIERLQQELSKAKASSSKQIKSLPKELLSELECPICLDPFEDPCIVPECCHRFCTSCIESSIKECGKECPLCRKRVTSKRALRKDGFIERITNVIFGKNQGKDGEDNS